MKILLFSFALVGTTLWSCSQRLTAMNLPSVVQNAVHVKYPEAKTIEWDKHGSHYEAEFELAAVEHTVLVDAKGQVLMHKQDLDSSASPQAVVVALKRDFPSYLIDDLEKVEKEGQVYYQVELENQNEELQKVYASGGAVANTSYWE